MRADTATLGSASSARRAGAGAGRAVVGTEARVPERGIGSRVAVLEVVGPAGRVRKARQGSGASLCVRSFLVWMLDMGS